MQKNSIEFKIKQYETWSVSMILGYFAFLIFFNERITFVKNIWLKYGTVILKSDETPYISICNASSMQNCEFVKCQEYGEYLYLRSM